MDAGESPLSIEDKVPLPGCQLAPGHVERDAMLPRRLAQLCLVGAIFGTGPRLDRPIVERSGLVRDDQIEIEVEGVAEALAARACAVGIVERKKPWFGLAINFVAALAFEGLGKAQQPWLRLPPVGGGSDLVDEFPPTHDSPSRRSRRCAPGSPPRPPSDRRAQRWAARNRDRGAIPARRIPRSFRFDKDG